MPSSKPTPEPEIHSSRPPNSTGTVSARTGSPGLLATGISGAISLPALDDVLDLLPEHVLLGHACDRPSSRVPEPDHAVAVDEDDPVADRFERPRRASPALGLGIEPGIVDRRRRMPRQLLGDGQVVLAVDPPGLGGDEADRAEDVPARDQRAP